MVTNMKRTQKELLDELEEVEIFEQEKADIPKLVGLAFAARMEIERLNTVETNLRARIEQLTKG